ncbi:hypothetical protein DIE03_23695 [Burkholderia sp. Bp8992]|nr:hypothetical protein DIE03_23695 [Burkholderia sp. Bp8992]
MYRCVSVRPKFARCARSIGRGVSRVQSVAPSHSARLLCRTFPVVIAPLRPGPYRASFSRHSPYHRHFSRKKYRCKKATLQLSSYVVESGVFSHDEASFYAGFCRV